MTQPHRFPSAVIDELLRSGAMARVSPDRPGAEEYLRQASRHLASAQQLDRALDPIGAFNLVYEAIRKCGSAILLNEGLRATGGDGGHKNIGVALDDQLGRSAWLRPGMFRLFVRIRNAGAYGSRGGRAGPTAGRRRRPRRGDAAPGAGRQTARPHAGLLNRPDLTPAC